MNFFLPATDAVCSVSQQQVGGCQMCGRNMKLKRNNKTRRSGHGRRVSTRRARRS